MVVLDNDDGLLLKIKTKARLNRPARKSRRWVESATALASG
jgi:hypothetical protein